LEKLLSGKKNLVSCKKEKRVTFAKLWEGEIKHQKNPKDVKANNRVSMLHPQPHHSPPSGISLSTHC